MNTFLSPHEFPTISTLLHELQSDGFEWPTFQCGRCVGAVCWVKEKEERVYADEISVSF
jgi:hypothetical protein